MLNDESVEDEDQYEEDESEQEELIEALHEAFDSLQLAFSEFDRILKKFDLHKWNRWKAGGKLVSNEFHSNYPCAEECIEGLED